VAIDCIPHALGHFVPHVHHLVRHHHHAKPHTPIVIMAATKPRVLEHHVRLRECPPGAIVAPLADLDNDNIAAIYMLPYSGMPTADQVAVSSGADATPAEASGLDRKHAA
jgi:hypothetical protein